MTRKPKGETPKTARKPFPKRYNEARVRRTIQLPDTLDAALCALTEQAQRDNPSATYSDVVRGILTRAVRAEASP